MEWALLKTEIAKPAYNGMNDFQVADAINAATYQVTQDIPTDLAKMAFIYTTAYDWGEVVGIVNGAITASAIKKKRATTLHELFNTATPIEVSDTSVAGEAWWTFLKQLLTEMVADGTITTPGRTAFEALRLKLAPLWRKFENRPIEWSDVQAARVWVA